MQNSNTIIDPIHKFYNIERKDRQILELFSELCDKGNIVPIEQLFLVIPNLKLITFNEHINLSQNEHLYISEGLNKAFNKKFYNIVSFILNNIPSIFFTIHDKFFLACRENNIELINIFIDILSSQISLSLFINTHDFLFRLSEEFNHAALNNKLDVMRIIRNFNQNITIKYNDIIQNSCQKGYVDIIRFLYDINRDIDFSFKDQKFFHTACEYGFLDIVEFILDVRNDIDIFNCKNKAIKDACINNHSNVLQFLFQKANESDENIKKKFDFQSLLECYCVAVNNENIEIFKTIQLFNENRIHKIPLNIRNKNIHDIQRIENFTKQNSSIKFLFI